MKGAFRVEGGRELADALRGLAPRVRRSVAREALRDVAEPMRLQMARLAPRGQDAPHLADNIVISNATKRDLKGADAIGVRVGPARLFHGAYAVRGRSGRTRTVGSSVYAYFQEWGTSRHGAQPFMRPAFDATVQAVTGALGKVLWPILASRGAQRTARVNAPISGGPGRRGL